MIYNIKKRQGLVKIEKSALTTVRLKNLIKFVDKRKERVVKLLCKERLEDKFQQFMLVEQIPAIEGKLWNMSCMRELGRWSNESDPQLLYSEYY